MADGSISISAPATDLPPRAVWPDLPDDRSNAGWTAMQDDALRCAVTMRLPPDEAAKRLAIFRPGVTLYGAMARATALGLDWDQAQRYPASLIDMSRRMFAIASGDLLTRLVEPLDAMMQAHRVLARLWWAETAGPSPLEAQEAVDDIGRLIAEASRKAHEVRDLFVMVGVRA